MFDSFDFSTLRLGNLFIEEDAGSAELRTKYRYTGDIIMPSLSTNAGSERVRKNHFDHLGTGSSTVVQSINGTPGAPYGLRYDIRSHSTEFCVGRDQKDFHKRRNSGELLPYTKYTNISQNVVYSGPSTVYFGGTTLAGNVYRYDRTWTDGSTAPLWLTRGTSRLMFAPEAEANRLLDSLGIDKLLFVQQAAARIYGRGWDALTFMAEFHKLVKMFRTAVPKLLKLLTEFQKWRTSSDAIRFGYSLIDEWLETRYGWRILLYDLEDIETLIREIDNDELSRVKDRAGDDWSDSIDEMEFYQDASIRFEQHYVTGRTLSVRGNVIADFLPSKVTTNLPLTAWELTRFSFVVDWFINVGRAIEAMSFVLLNDRYTASASVFFRGSQVATQEVIFFPSGSYKTDTFENFSDVQFFNEWEFKQRQPVVVPTLPRPSLNLNAFKVADLVALILKAMRKLIT